MNEFFTKHNYSYQFYLVCNFYSTRIIVASQRQWEIERHIDWYNGVNLEACKWVGLTQGWSVVVCAHSNSSFSQSVYRGDMAIPWLQPGF